MAPSLIGNTFILAETAINSEDKNSTHKTNSDLSLLNKDLGQPKTKQALEVEHPSKDTYRVEIVWRNVGLFIILHSLALWGLYTAIFEKCGLVFLWCLLLGACGAFGITAGAHRLWSHRAYKANLPLRIILMLCQTLAFQNPIYIWVRDHRVHHKYTDTNADPHNSRRGFFFSHIGWLMCKKHPDVMKKGENIDMSDVAADPVVKFQQKYYLIMMPIFCFVIPAAIPYYAFGATFKQSFLVASVLRYTLSLHFTWLVNSAAHMYGMKPYDKNISPTNTSIVAVLAFGEGWHNYHHVFPWDYKTAELGDYSLNYTTAVIDFFAKLGWASDLKTASWDMIKKRIARTGDGSHPYSGELKKPNEISQNIFNSHEHDTNDNIWGWDDKDLTEEDRHDAQIMNKLD